MPRCQTIAQEIRYQYTAGYTPTTPIAKGTREWRSVRVSCTEPSDRSTGPSTGRIHDGVARWRLTQGFDSLRSLTAGQSTRVTSIVCHPEAEAWWSRPIVEAMRAWSERSTSLQLAPVAVCRGQ